MAEEGAKAGMAVHGNEYHDPDFEQEGAAAALVEAHRTTQVHTQDQPPAEHGNAKHNPDFEQEGVAASLVGTHEAKTTAIHGVGGSTIESASGSQGKVDTHEAKTTGVHGVGAGTVAKVGDIAVDANLSPAGQDAISKRHSQNTDKIITDADGDTALEVEKSADEDKIRGKVKGVEALLIDDAGVLTLAKQSAFSAYIGTDQSVNTGTWTKLQLNAEIYDIQSEFDIATNYRFTAKTAGIWSFAAGANIADIADGKRLVLSLYKNGAEIARLADLYTGGTGYMTLTGSAQLKLSVNDYIELWVYHTHGAARWFGANPATEFLHGIKVA
jgi:hypothetical protein